jgi:hypothetical protein
MLVESAVGYSSPVNRLLVLYSLLESLVNIDCLITAMRVVGHSCSIEGIFFAKNVCLSAYALCSVFFALISACSM